MFAITTKIRSFGALEPLRYYLVLRLKYVGQPSKVGEKGWLGHLVARATHRNWERYWGFLVVMRATPRTMGLGVYLRTV